MQEQIIWISKKYKSTKLTKKNATLNDFIDVFEDKINGWYLNWAYSINKKRHSGFAALHICFSYFEAIYIFKEGKSGRSEDYFKRSFRLVFSDVLQHIPSDKMEDLLKTLYKEARCGFFHIGMSRQKIALDDNRIAIRIDQSADGQTITKIRIDRNSFIEEVRKDFKSYLSNLRDINPIYKQLRKNFVDVWNESNLIPISDEILTTI